MTPCDKNVINYNNNVKFSSGFTMSLFIPLFNKLEKFFFFFFNKFTSLIDSENHNDLFETLQQAIL